MSRTPGPAQPLPVGAAAVTYDQIKDATACPDCDSAVQFVPMRFPGHDATVFGVYIAHDHTCPLINQAEEHRG